MDGKNEKEDAALSNEVFSIKTHRPVNPEAPSGIVAEQKKQFESIKVGNNSGSEDVNSSNLDSATEAKRQSPEYEKARADWEAARNRSKSIEKEFNEKYHAHVLEQSKGLRGLVNLPRRMFGIEPRLSNELEMLKGASAEARRAYREAGKNLRDTKVFDTVSVGRDEKIAKRYERMLAHHLTVSVHRARLEEQKSASAEAWGTNKIRPVIETLNKYKYARIAAMTLGYGVLGGLTGGLGAAAVGGGAYLGRVLASMGIGVVTGASGQLLFVRTARERLVEAEEKVGQDFFKKDFLAEDEAIEFLSKEVTAKQAQVKTSAALSGLIFGTTDWDGSLSAPTSVAEPAIKVSPPSIDEIPTPEPLAPLEPNPVDKIPSPQPLAPVETTPIEPNIEIPQTDPETVPQDDQSVGDSELVQEDSVKRAPPPPPPHDATTRIPNFSTGPNIETPDVDPETVSEPPADYVPEDNQASSNSDSATSTYIVEKGDNVWNILEGKGSDANPIGGKSEVLQGMSLADRQIALDKLIEYYEAHPEEAIEAGVVKSEGNINKVYPGEELNISMFDSKLREILGTETKTAEIPAVSNEVLPDLDEVLEDGDVPPTSEQLNGRETARLSDLTTDESVESVASGINQMRVQDILDLQKAVTAGDQQAIDSLKSFDLNIDSLQSLVNDIFEHGQGNVNGNLTLQEYFNNTSEIKSINSPEISNLDAGASDISQMKAQDIFPESTNEAEVNIITDINKLPVNKILEMYDVVAADDPAALFALGRLGLDKNSYMDLNRSISEQIGRSGPGDLQLPLTEWRSSLPESGVSNDLSNTNAYEAPVETDSSSSSVQTEVVPNADAANLVTEKFVNNIEKSKGILFREPDVSGTFSGLKNVTFADLKIMASNGNLESAAASLNVSPEGYERWMGVLDEQVRSIPPANDNETVGSFINRVASARGA